MPSQCAGKWDKQSVWGLSVDSKIPSQNSHHKQKNPNKKADNLNSYTISSVRIWTLPLTEFYHKSCIVKILYCVKLTIEKKNTIALTPSTRMFLARHCKMPYDGACLWVQLPMDPEPESSLELKTSRVMRPWMQKAEQNTQKTQIQSSTRPAFLSDFCSHAVCKWRLAGETVGWYLHLETQSLVLGTARSVT